MPTIGIRTGTDGEMMVGLSLLGTILILRLGALRYVTLGCGREWFLDVGPALGCPND